MRNRSRSQIHPCIHRSATSNLVFALTSVLSACPHAGKLSPVSAHTLPVGLPPPIGRSRQTRVRGAVAPGTSMKPLEGLKIDVTRGSGAPDARPQP